MADVKFTIQYDINTDAPIPAPRAVLTMKVKADEDGRIPVSVRCTDRILMESMDSAWGTKKDGETIFRVRMMTIKAESWLAIQALVEEVILGAIARMQEADARYQKLIAEKPADYVYETSVPGPAKPTQTLYNAETLYKVDLIAENSRAWAMEQFGLSQPPCESAAKFLSKHSDDITRHAKELYGGQWWNLTPAQRFDAGISWLWAFGNDEDTVYPIDEWVEWAGEHRA